MTSKKDINSYNIIEDQGFDEYGHLVYRKFGNGAENIYTFDNILHRLETSKLSAANGNLLNVKYLYDKIGNILNISNLASSDSIGGIFDYSYTYDNLNRLTAAKGNCNAATYDLSMQYDIMSNPLKKVLKTTNSLCESQNLDYIYNNNDQPNAAAQIGNALYEYDFNGNPTMRNDTSENTLRQMIWDEENRLQSLSDDGILNEYVYDYSGNRVIKSRAATSSVFTNGAPQGIINTSDKEWTMYVSPDMTVDNERFTKHY